MDSRIIKKMEKNKITRITKIVVLFFVLFSMLSNAQTGLPEVPVDEPVAPIDDCIWVLVLIGLCYGSLTIKTLVYQENPSNK